MDGNKLKGPCVVRSGQFVAHRTCAGFLPQEIATTVAEEAFEEEDDGDRLQRVCVAKREIYMYC